MALFAECEECSDSIGDKLCIYCYKVFCSNCKLSHLSLEQFPSHIFHNISPVVIENIGPSGDLTTPLFTPGVSCSIWLFTSLVCLVFSLISGVSCHLSLEQFPSHIFHNISPVVIENIGNLEEYTSIIGVIDQPKTINSVKNSNIVSN
jgi:hypothetical protein